jgi:hypothetical protein
MKAGVAQDNHALFNLANEPLKGLVCDIGGGTRPPHNPNPANTCVTSMHQ